MTEPKKLSNGWFPPTLHIMKRLSSQDFTKRERNMDNSDKNKKRVSLVRNKRKLKSIKNYLIDYTENSNLHGLKYIGEKERTRIEKIFWVIMFTCSVILCAILIHKIWKKWNENPVIVTFAEKSTPVWHIPYPAVTICSESRVMASLFNFTQYYHLYQNSYSNLTDEAKEKFEHVSMICKKSVKTPKAKTFSIDSIKKVSPARTDIFSFCRWNKDEYTDCGDIFFPTLTEEGFCYTFNIMDSADMFREENLHSNYIYVEQRNRSQTWGLETGYLPSAPLKTYPHRSSGSGPAVGLNLYLKYRKENIDPLCGGSTRGFKILLHNPAECASVSGHHISLPLSQKVLVAIKPNMITTTEGLRRYDPERRLCYFQDERYLSYFKVYTQNNCEMECLANYTYARCGCVHFALPHGPNMQTCDPTRKACLRTSQTELVTIEIQSGMKQPIHKKKISFARDVAARCNCLPACTSIHYDAETSQTDFDRKDYYRALKIPYSSIENISFSRVRIYFKEDQFITSRRSELYGRTDFLANCGGLLGLFMGFSFLSVIEIIYFLTLRLWCVLRRQNTRNSVQTCDISTITPVQSGFK